jgi:hypothetical protein
MDILDAQHYGYDKTLQVSLAILGGYVPGKSLTVNTITRISGPNLAYLG